MLREKNYKLMVNYNIYYMDKQGENCKDYQKKITQEIIPIFFFLWESE